MPCNIKNPANIDLSAIEGHVQDLYTHVHNKIGFNKPPTMVFDSDPQNEANVLGKTAYYDPNSIQIHVYTDGRHPKDMLRSIAHELIHHWQNEEGRLDVGGYSGPGYYLKNKDLKDLEDEAMTLGTKLFREYEDNRKLKEKKEMSLNEWKNNELNRLLMKKFGILNEKADKNDGLEKLKEMEEDETSYGHYDKKAPGVVNEDSGEDEAWNDWKNEHADDNHIEEIRKHLRALEEDRDYDRKGAEYDHDDYEDDRKDEHRKHKDKLVGHEDRGQPDRVQNLQEDGDGIENDLLTKGQEENSNRENSIGSTNESLRRKIKKVLKENKKVRLRFK